MVQCSSTIRTVLDHPYTYVYGEHEPVSGTVQLECELPPSNISLESHEVALEVQVTLCGRAQSRIWRDPRRKRLLHSADVQLFAEKSTILQQNLNMESRRRLLVPFSLAFPRTTQADLQSLLWQDGAKGIYEGNPEHPLPPSTFARSSYAAHPFLAVIEYLIDARISTRCLNGTVVQSNCAESTRVYYEKGESRTGNSPRDMRIHRLRTDISDHDLMWRLRQTRGIKAKARSLTESVVMSTPHREASIGVTCYIPRQLRIGDPITCVVSPGSIQPQDQDDTALPALYLTFASLHLYETIHARTERLAGNMPESDERTGLLGMEFIVDPCEPFHSAARDTKTISTRKLRETPVSFATYNIARSFDAVVTIRIEAQKWSKTFEIEQPVEICSGKSVQNFAENSQVHLQSIQQTNCTMDFNDIHGQRATSHEQLPSYEESIARR